MRKFNIAMCIAWLFITIIYIILAIAKVNVPAWNVAWPCGICASYYFDKILDNTNKKEK